MESDLEKRVSQLERTLAELLHRFGLKPIKGEELREAYNLCEVAKSTRKKKYIKL